MKPIIGIVVCGFSDNRQYVSHSYIRAIENNNGIPILIPVLSLHCPSMQDSLEKNHAVCRYYAELCNGFLFCGGDDITPLLFDEEPMTAAGMTDLRTDLFQISLMEHILRTEKPVLAICRGMQILNVTLGGNIYQDLTHFPQKTLVHMQQSYSRSDVSHPVFFEKGSILHHICGESTFTNSFHHQAVRDLGKQLSATGRTSDGVIEAIELTVHPFAVGIQWHPECMLRFSTRMQTLFHKFISVAADTHVYT